MCQIVSGNRSDVEDLPITSFPTRRFPRRPISIGDSKDILLCPVMSKISFPPKGSAAAAATRKVDSFTPTVKFLANNEEKHSCVICSQFVEDAEDAGKQSSPQNTEITLQSVFKYAPRFLFFFFFKLYWSFFNKFDFAYRVLRRSTQPAHLLVMSTVIALAMLFYPRKSSFVVLEIQSSADSTLWPLLYLSSFSILFGAQMWMTFVSGKLSFLLRSFIT